MWRRIAMGLALWSVGVGCANLEVKKVSTDKRLAGTDRVKGFRYYLSRPYVVVKAPILVCEHSTLYVQADRTDLPQVGLQGLPTEGTEKVLRINPASGAFEGVSEGELATLRQLMSEPGSVQQVGRKKQQPASSPVIIQQPAGGIIAADAAAAGSGDVVNGGAVHLTDNSSSSQGGSSGSAGGGSLSLPTVSQDQALTARTTAHLDGDIQVMFLPDLDEQYAIHNSNFLSKSSYALNFADGWQLTDVGGEFDSTAVPLEILNFIDKAIDSAKTVALAGVDRRAKILGGDPTQTPVPKLTAQRVVYRVVTSTYLKPGVYRVNKPWEMNGEHPPSGCGLLAKMGLATFDTARIEINPAPRALGDIKQDCSMR